MHCSTSRLVFTFSVLIFSAPALAQVSEDSALFRALQKNDSLVFDVGFNTCDMTRFDKLFADDLEFYHDTSGATYTKAEFIDGLANGICGAEDFKSRRELVDGSLEVFPLYENGELYGAIQKGLHRFYERPKGQPETAGSVARFIHLWLLENGTWKIARILSYDHLLVPPESEAE